MPHHLDDTTKQERQAPSSSAFRRGEPAPSSRGTGSRAKGAADDGPPPVIPGYELIEVIGRGGMGLVWRAVEQRLDREVALKVHRATDKDVPEDNLWAEALVAARIGDPSIVRVLDVGFTLDDRAYYAMELVLGTDLGVLLADGPLTPRKAVSIAADIARAAAAAHRHGVVHRDLKPRNIIIDDSGRARVLDFGIALDERRADDPHSGAIVGTPRYMAPEQIVGNPVGPWTDIYAIGVTLYEMLTGCRPFESDNLETLFQKIIHGDASPPSGHRPNDVHADLDAIVLRCMAKKPSDRFSSAGSLFEVLSGVAGGERVDIVPSAMRPPAYTPKTTGTMPAVKPRRSEAKRHLAWSWQLTSSPDALWPYVADTDRFNKAVGLAPVAFTDEARADGVVKRTGEIRVLGMHVSWREFPFEWIRDREHSVFRWYNAGPISALWNRVTLVPLSGGGTDLRHEVWLSPRGVVGQVAAFIEIDRKLGPAFDKFYRHLDELLSKGTALSIDNSRGQTRADPFDAPFSASISQRNAVEDACAKLHGEGFDKAIVEKLAMHLLTSATGALGTMRPYELADAWSTDRGETLDAFLHAARLGLLEPAWDVICPRCMIAHESLSQLSDLKRASTCSACATTFERDLRDSVELVFLPAPSVRPIERVTYCLGSPAKRPHVLVQQVLEPGEVRVVNSVPLPRGTYRAVFTVAKAAHEVVSSAIGFESKCEITTDGKSMQATPSILKAGVVQLTLRNDNEVEETFRIEVEGAREDGVSAVAALTHPSFRTFFHRQLLAHGEHVRVRQLAFLFAELASPERVFGELGDGGTCAELAALDEIVTREASEHEGNIIPSSLSGLVCAFPSPLRAFQAALSLRKHLSEGWIKAPISLAIHDGRCIALTRGDRPEFFGETLHRGEALLVTCRPGGIAVSASVASDRAVAIAMQECGYESLVDKTPDGPYAGRRVVHLIPPLV